ncbi:Glycoside hydrolase, family 71 [Phaffia rhodozyma]|uniref:Glycoside hydrolase, family 71 n=1 Tax=Phaffia rhodozyma TaxID=264483 RepID=A0A0F7SEL0_PHARH|nr:Glycoside hydrolase, family 71 [Phaffia rhodozyma]
MQSFLLLPYLSLFLSLLCIFPLSVTGRLTHGPRRQPHQGSSISNLLPPRLSFGNSTRISRTLSRRASASPPTMISSGGTVWTSQGCVTDGSARALTGYSVDSSSMTPELCVATCLSQGYIYAGLEYYTQCMCGNTLSNGQGTTASSGCTTPCGGNTTVTCGGSYALNLYKETSTGIATSSSYNFVGCYVDSASSRVLGTIKTQSSSLTVDSCTSYCFRAGYTYAGMEYGTECYCASSLPSSLTAGTCSSACGGSSSQTCGGSYLISVYKAIVSVPSAPSGTTYYGCVSDTSAGRALTGYTYSDTAGMTNAACAATCLAKGYTFSGTEYSYQCYCGYGISNSQTIVGDASCTASCAANATEACGGNYLLTVFQSTSSNSIPNVAGWSYLGCYTDSATRTLSDYSATGLTGMTVQSCIALCNSKGYSNAGMEYSTECYCGNTLSSSASLMTSSNCNSICGGDGTQKCGGSYLLSVYTSSTVWTSVGCVTDGSSRALTGASTSTSSMTIESCEVYCRSMSYTIAGLEYGSQCYCGNDFTSGLGVAASGCSTACAGNSSEICGGAYLLSAYSFSIPPTLPNARTGPCSSTNSYTPTLSAPSSSSTKYIISHFMVGNTYPYTESDWLQDITLAYNSGVDAFALNIGTDDWQITQVASAYKVAAAHGKGFKLFFSLDMSVWSCGSISSTMANLISNYAANANQFYYQNKVLVSTFAGESCGDGAWTNLRSVLSAKGVSMYFLPAFFSGFDSYTSYDGIFNWNSAWSMDANPVTTSSDKTWIANAVAKGKTYMPSISPLFFTHYGVNSYNKNWIYQSDNWPLSLRWQQLISMRDQFDLVEQITWNDYGESHYMGPIHGAQPNSQAWVDGFDHQVYLAINTYYTTAFKTGKFPAITCDKVYLSARPHVNTAVATADTAGAPPTLTQTGASGSNTAEINSFFALVFATAPSTVTLSSGTSSTTFSVNAGISSLASPLVGGQGMKVVLTRSGSTYVDYSPSNYTFATTTTEYNFNYKVYASS